MIFDLLAHQALYRAIHPGFAASFDWLQRFDPATPDGKIEIDGDRVFALVQSYTSVSASEKKMETHVQHIDIQYLAGGREIMQVAPRGALTVTEPYDPARDVAFYADPAQCVTLECAPGAFSIFFPHDAHKPGCASGGPVLVKKVVIKIKV